jgi:hypothetical protein
VLQRDVGDVSNDDAEPESKEFPWVKSKLLWKSIRNLHHRWRNEQETKTKHEAATRVMFFVERLRTSATSSSASAAAKAQSDERHQKGGDNGHNSDDDNEPVLLEQVVILMLLHVRTPIDFHVAHDKIACEKQE